MGIAFRSTSVWVLEGKLKFALSFLLLALLSIIFGFAIGWVEPPWNWVLAFVWWIVQLVYITHMPQLERRLISDATLAVVDGKLAVRKD